MISYNSVKLDRKKLYDEIWELSATGVAKKHNLNYAKLINSLKENNIPYPSSGYWTRLACGKDVSNEVIPLPESEVKEICLIMAGYSVIKKKNMEEKANKTRDDEVVVESRKQEENITTDIPKDENIVDASLLSFLEEKERQCVIKTITNIEVKPNARLHPVLIAYKKRIQEWKQSQKESNYGIRQNYYSYGSRRNMEQPPFLNEVSEGGINRVIVILDSLYKVVEGLGGTINSDLSMQIREDVVKVGFAEGQDKKDHELTKQEAKALLEYKEKVKFHEYASNPQIRKYDYYYNGKLRIKFDNGKYIRDNEQQKIEERLDEILIQLYELSEESRINREKREQEHQRYLEEQRRKEELAKRISEEKRKTQALANEAKDYQIAFEIRKYIQATLEKEELTEENQEWIKWAKDKADWYDPIIAREDEYLGKRMHAEDEAEKKLINEARRGGYGW